MMIPAVAARQVNGVVVSLGTPVTDKDIIQVNPQGLSKQSEKVTILINKPVGMVSAQAEHGYTPAVTLFVAENRWEGDRSPRRYGMAQRVGMAPAGRLDIDSTGLLILTQDGRVARQLIGEDTSTDKEYLVRVQYGPLQPDEERQTNVQDLFPEDQLKMLRLGLTLDGVRLKSAQVDWQNPEQLRFVLREGRKRQIRRMCEAVGLLVVGLKRVRIGKVALGSLPPGQWRYLKDGESFV